jgi:hypothetical protein
LNSDMHLRTYLCFYNGDTELRQSRQAVDAKRYASRRWSILRMEILFDASTMRRSEML